jgi:transposase InsO family protein
LQTAYQLGLACRRHSSPVEQGGVGGVLFGPKSFGLFESDSVANVSERLDFFRKARRAWRTIALPKHGTPEIVNTDQGAQFTGETFTDLLITNGIKISMDGKGAWRDNVFVERLWRSVKYEEVYLRAYDSVAHARASIGRYLDFYNGRRPHSSIDGMTPDQVYFAAQRMLPIRLAA